MRKAYCYGAFSYSKELTKSWNMRNNSFIPLSLFSVTRWSVRNLFSHLGTYTILLFKIYQYNAIVEVAGVNCRQCLQLSVEAGRVSSLSPAA